jgi:hypothetical protein
MNFFWLPFLAMESDTTNCSERTCASTPK